MIHMVQRDTLGKSKLYVLGLRNPAQHSDDALKGKLRHDWKSGLDTTKEGFMLKVSFLKKIYIYLFITRHAW